MKKFLAKKLTANCLLLTAIIIIAAFLRLYNITELPPGLYPDEAMNGNNALEALSTNDWKVFYPENNGREGLFINIQALSIALFGNFPWALRIVSALFGILTILGVYLLTKEIFCENPKSQILNPKQIQIPNVQNSKLFKVLDFKNWNLFRNSDLEIRNCEVALLSTFFLATSFWHINFSRIGFRAIMAPAFLVWSIFLLLKALNQTKNNFQFSIFNFQSNLKIILFSIIGGIFYGLGFHSYIAYRATPALILIIIALYWFQIKRGTNAENNAEQTWKIKKRILLSTFCFLLTTFIVAAPLGYYFIQNPQDFMGRTTQVSVFNPPTPLKDLGMNILKTAGMFNFSGDYNWRHNYAGKPLLFWPVGILFLIGLTISIRRLFSKDFFAPIFIFSWLIIAALPIIISNEGLPHALRAIIMIPPVFILAGIGGIYIYKKIKDTALINESKIKINLLRLSAAAFLIILIIQGYKSYFIAWGKNPNTQGAFAADYVQIGRELNALPNPPAGGLPKYVIVEADGTDVRGIPMPTQTVMFITDTFTPEKQKEKNIFYILPAQANKIPNNKDIYTTIIK